MPPRRGCRLAVANEAFFHNAQFVIIRPMPAAFTIGCGKYFDLRTIDKVGHKLGLTIGLSLRSDGHRRRFTLDIQGKLLELLSFGDSKKAASLSTAACSLNLVAGVGFEPTTFRL